MQIFFSCAFFLVLTSSPGLVHPQNLSEYSSSWTIDSVITANSEMSNPLFFGTTPYESFVLNRQNQKSVNLDSHLKELVQAELENISGRLGRNTFEIEMWPARSESVAPAMVLARWRADGSSE